MLAKKTRLWVMTVAMGVIAATTATVGVVNEHRPIHQVGTNPAAEAAKQSIRQTTPQYEASLRTDWPKIQVAQVGLLPQVSMGNTGVTMANQIMDVGGYTGVVSLSGIDSVLPKAKVVSQLPILTHDAAAAAMNGHLYVFGGGQSASYNTIVERIGTHSYTVGYLPHPLSDAVAVPWTLNGSQGIVVLGGYDGNVFNQDARWYHEIGKKIYSRTLFHLPVGLRYAAVATDGSTIWIAGGLKAAGTSNAVYAYNRRSHAVKQVAVLPYGVQKAAMFFANGNLILVGGEESNQAITSNILAISTHLGTVKSIGRLPQPLSDMGYAQIGNVGYTLGGYNGRAAVADVYAIHIQ